MRIAGPLWRLAIDLLVREVRPPIAIDAAEKDGGGTKRDDPPRRDRGLDARARIAPDALAFGADGKIAERAQFYGLTTHQCVADFVECHFEEFAGLCPRKTGRGCINRLEQIGARGRA